MQQTNNLPWFWPRTSDSASQSWLLGVPTSIFEQTITKKTSGSYIIEGKLSPTFGSSPQNWTLIEFCSEEDLVWKSFLQKQVKCFFLDLFGKTSTSQLFFRQPYSTCIEEKIGNKYFLRKNCDSISLFGLSAKFLHWCFHKWLLMSTWQEEHF